MSELTICARVLVKDGHCDFVKEELLKLIAPTRLEEGCISYKLHQANDNKNLFIFFEHWQSVEILEKHLQSKHLKDYLKATDNLIEEFIVTKLTQIA